MREFKRGSNENAEGNMGYLKGKVARKPWITTAIMEKMQERRKWKNKDTEEGKRTYRRLNNELRRETDQARERWWENECQDKMSRQELEWQRMHSIKEKSC